MEKHSPYPEGDSYQLKTEHRFKKKIPSLEGIKGWGKKRLLTIFPFECECRH